MKTCCFAGHRDYDENGEAPYASIRRIIQKGVCMFYSGGMGNFDRACEKAVK